MADAATTTGADTTSATTTTTTTAAANWYDGKASPEDIGLWQNKVWDTKDPAVVAMEATKALREAQKFIGVPHEELVRFPKTPGAPEWQNVWDRIGAPKEAAGYDLSGMKFSNGTAVDPAVQEVIRTAAFKAHVPVSAMPEFTGEFVKYLEGQQAGQQADAAAKLQTERTALQTNWGSNLEANKFIAAQGAKALGLDDVVLSALENTAGYAKTMEALLRVGKMNGEDKYVVGAGGTGIMSKEQASERLTSLKQDPIWRDKLLNGDAAAKREFNNLSMLTVG